MSYEEILETTEDGRFRVKLVLDECPPEPYDDGQSPLLRIDRDGRDTTHVMATGRPLDADSYVEAAVERWGGPYSRDWPLVEKYLRAFHGVTQVETWHSGSYWYVTYDSATWREHVDAPEGSADMSEYRAWCEGDVWDWVVEKRVTWTASDPGCADEDRWEHVDSCGGYYGSDGANGEYLRQCAREALAYEDEPYAHMAGAHEISQDMLTRWGREIITRKHARYHELGLAGSQGHAHDDPHAPFAVSDHDGVSGPLPADAAARERLEYLRGELRAERISYGELAELRGLARYIEAGDTELLEAAGVPESVEAEQDRIEALVREAEDSPFLRRQEPPPA